MKAKTASKANETQVKQKLRCLANLQKYASNEFTCTITNEKIILDGMLQFILSKEAKPNTGMLFLTNTSWVVHIGRRGKVRSLDCSKDEELTDNEYCTFI
jgi:hypothetical protein